MLYQLINQESNRLKFRLLERTDFNAWMEFCKSDEAAGYVGMANIKTPMERCESWFEKVEHRHANNLGTVNALISKSSGALKGLSGIIIQEVDGKKEIEIAYSILPAYWGNGYATEAAQKCRDYAFENKFTESLISIVHVNNVRSEKVARKNGMTLLNTTIFKEMPVNIFQIKRSEWERLW